MPEGNRTGWTPPLPIRPARTGPSPAAPGQSTSDKGEVPVSDFAPGVLEFAERAAIENMKARGEQAVLLMKQATTTLTVLLAGVGGALTFGVRVFATAGGATPVDYAAPRLGADLSMLAALLIWRCLWVRPFPMVFNEPIHLAQCGMTLDQVREGELCNMQLAIDRAVERNRLTARWLNAIRLMASGSPLVAFAVVRYYAG